MSKDYKSGTANDDRGGTAKSSDAGTTRKPGQAVQDPMHQQDGAHRPKDTNVQQGGPKKQGEMPRGSK